MKKKIIDYLFRFMLTLFILIYFSKLEIKFDITLIFLIIIFLIINIIFDKVVSK
jgi:hypothetical protein